MRIKVPVSRRSAWGSELGASKTLDCTAKLYTSHPQFVRVVDVESEVEDGMTVEFAVVEIDDAFPVADGFVATQWEVISNVIATGAGDEGGDCIAANFRDITHEVRCEYGNHDTLEGRDFQSAFNAWLDITQPGALGFLKKSERTTRWVSVSSWLRRTHCWGMLATWLRWNGVQISRIGERVKPYGLDEGTYGLKCCPSLSQVRIAQALGFEPQIGEPEPWEGLLDSEELQLPTS